jgi:hypothetical protein
MKSVEESVTAALYGSDADLFPFLPFRTLMNGFLTGYRSDVRSRLMHTRIKRTL